MLGENKSVKKNAHLDAPPTESKKKKEKRRERERGKGLFLVKISAEKKNVETKYFGHRLMS